VLFRRWLLLRIQATRAHGLALPSFAHLFGDLGDGVWDMPVPELKRVDTFEADELRADMDRSTLWDPATKTHSLDAVLLTRDAATGRPGVLAIQLKTNEEGSRDPADLRPLELVMSARGTAQQLRAMHRAGAETGLLFVTTRKVQATCQRALNEAFENLAPAAGAPQWRRLLSGDDLIKAIGEGSPLRSCDEADRAQRREETARLLQRARIVNLDALLRLLGPTLEFLLDRGWLERTHHAAEAAGAEEDA